MPFNKYLFFSILLLFSASINGQNLTDEDIDATKTRISNGIALAQKNIDNNSYYQAQKDLDDALKLAKEIDDKRSIGLIYSKIGKLQFIIEETDEAIKSLVKAIEKQRFAKDNANIAETYKTMGNVYMSKEKYESALEYYKSAETLFEQEDLHNFEAEVILERGIAFLKLNEYKKADKELSRAIVLSKRYLLNKILSSAYINKGYTETKLGDLDKGYETSTKGYKLAKDNSYDDVLINGYLTLSEINEQKGNIETANNFLRTHIKLSDSLLAQKRSYLSQ